MECMKKVSFFSFRISQPEWSIVSDHRQNLLQITTPQKVHCSLAVCLEYEVPRINYKISSLLSLLLSMVESCQALRSLKNLSSWSLEAMTFYQLTYFFRLALQKQAIADVKSAYTRLPHSDAMFQHCLDGKETLAEVITAVEQKSQAFKRKKSVRCLQKLQKHTTWLQNISSVVDIAVQTQAGIGCPLWAPIKFVLKVSILTSI